MGIMLAEEYDALIGKTKWELSEKEGRDVGTPYTVYFLLVADSSLLGNLTREHLIRRYLLADVCDDKHGADGSRLKGELMRWDAQRSGMNPHDIVPTNSLKQTYAREQGIDF